MFSGSSIFAMVCRSHSLEYIVSLPGGESVISLCLEGGRGRGYGVMISWGKVLSRETRVNMFKFNFWLANGFSSNRNTIGLKFTSLRKISTNMCLWGWSLRTRVVIRTVLVYHFIDPDLGVEIFFDTEGTAE